MDSRAIFRADTVFYIGTSLWVLLLMLPLACGVWLIAAVWIEKHPRRNGLMQFESELKVAAKVQIPVHPYAKICLDARLEANARAPARS